MCHGSPGIKPYRGGGARAAASHCRRGIVGKRSQVGQQHPRYVQVASRATASPCSPPLAPSSAVGAEVKRWRWTRAPAAPTRPPSFTHLGGAESTRELSLTDGQAANARVLAARAQNSSAGTAGRLPVQWHVEIQAVRAAVGPLVSPRCTRGAKRCLRSTWRAPRGASEAGTGGPPTRPIEADVRPTRPGRGDARGARGGL